MPSSEVRTFTDPDDYAASFREAQVTLTVTERGQFAAKLTRIDLPRVRIQRFSDNLPRIAHSALVSGCAMFSWLTRPGPPQLSSGVEMQSAGIMRHSEGNSNYLRSSGLACYGSMSLPVADMVSVGAEMAGLDVTPPKEARLHVPTPRAMERLQRLHTSAGRLAEGAPEIITNPDAARGLEQTLIEAMVDCLSYGERREPSLAQGQHATVMRRFHRVVEENAAEPLYIPEICRAIRVSERALRMCCQEHLGMGPKRYLVLRRMHMARRALRAAA